MSYKEIYITHAKRTAVGSLLGSLSPIAAVDLGALVIKAILAEQKLNPDIIDEVILGQVLTGGEGQNPARQSAIKSGIPNNKTAVTVNKVCGSGLKAVAMGANAILAGEHDILIVGGQENMSLGKHGVYMRHGVKLGDSTMVDFMRYDGLTDAFSGSLMGITAENIAARFGITREMQDEFSFNSHKKAQAATFAGKFLKEIVPVEIVQKKQAISFSRDESIRPETTIETLAKLRPAFDPKGTVTAGNASSINDGAACLLIASGDAVKKHNLAPLVRIVSYAAAGVDPDIMGTGPVPASQRALSKAGWKVEDLDLIECNEAFAAQAIYVNQQMKWDTSIVNVNGGAIALGHPIGASGARVLVTLIHSMLERKSKKGLVTLCIGGGMGIAMCVERI